MKVQLFRVHSEQGASFRKQLESISHLTLKKRERLAAAKSIQTVRLERIHHDSDFDLFYFDVVRSRTDHGPGRVAPGKAIEGFEMAPDEGFGEETAGLYVPKTQHLILQYNHHGAHPNAVAHYISKFPDDEWKDFELQACIRDDVAAELSRKTIFKSLDVKLDLRQLPPSVLEQGVGLGSAISAARSFHADKFQICISVQGKRSRSMNDPTRIIRTLWEAHKANRCAVDTLKMKAKDADDHPTEMIDFLLPRIEIVYDVVPGKDKRVPLNTRWRCLTSAYNDWKPLMKSALKK